MTEGDCLRARPAGNPLLRAAIDCEGAARGRSRAKILTHRCASGRDLGIGGRLPGFPLIPAERPFANRQSWATLARSRSRSCRPARR